LICDDLDTTVAELAAKGVQFDGEATGSWPRGDQGVANMTETQ